MTSRALLTAGSVLVLGSAVLAAEPVADPAGDPPVDPIAADPSITDNSVSTTRDQLAGRRRGGEEIRALGAENTAKAPLAYPEGTFLSKVEGSLLRLATGDLVFAPDAQAPGASAASVPPLVLLPNLALQRLESALSSSDALGESAPSSGPIVGRPRRVVLSGEAFVYAGRVYLLTSVFSLPAGKRAEDQDSKGTPPKEQALAQTPAAQEEQPAGEAADPSVGELIRDLESRRAIPRAIDPAASRNPEPGARRSGPSAPVTSEGTLIEARRGRVVRAPGGGLVFMPDSSASSPSSVDAPMGLLPCKLLETIEARGGGALPAEGRGDQALFRISGRVVVYRGRNYLLPTLAQLQPESDVTPLQ